MRWDVEYRPDPDDAWAAAGETPGASGPCDLPRLLAEPQGGDARAGYY